jgi:cytochrome c
MKSIIVSMVAAGLIVSGSAMAAAKMPAEGEKFCGACHNIEGKKVGPGFVEIAKKYQNDKNAATKITASINSGGSFGWKMGSMPPKGMGAGDADIKVIAQFIVGLAPAAAATIAPTPAAPAATPPAPVYAAAPANAAASADTKKTDANPIVASADVKKDPVKPAKKPKKKAAKKQETKPEMANTETVK